MKNRILSFLFYSFLLRRDVIGNSANHFSNIDLFINFDIIKNCFCRRSFVPEAVEMYGRMDILRILRLCHTMNMFVFARFRVWFRVKRQRSNQNYSGGKRNLFPARLQDFMTSRKECLMVANHEAERGKSNAGDTRG